MFVRHEDVIINTSKIQYIIVRENINQLVIYFDAQQSRTLNFATRTLMEAFYKLLN